MNLMNIIKSMKKSIADEIRDNPSLLPEQVMRNFTGKWKRLETGCLHPLDESSILAHKLLFVYDFYYSLEDIVDWMPLLFQDIPSIKIVKELNK